MSINKMKKITELMLLEEIAKINSTFELEKEGCNRNFIDMIIKNIASNSYELSDDPNAKNFNLLKMDFKTKEKSNQKLLVILKSQQMKINLIFCHF